MEHMYELDLIGIILMNDEKIFGYAIGSIFGNTAYIYQLISVDTDGAKEMLLVDYIDNREFLRTLLEAMYDELPAPKKRNNFKNIGA